MRGILSRLRKGLDEKRGQTPFTYSPPCLIKASFFLKKKTLPEPDRVGTKRNNKVLTTLLTDPEDQAATYSPVP